MGRCTNFNVCFNTSSAVPTQSFTCLNPGLPRYARSARVNYTSSAVPTLRRVVNYLVAVNRDKSRESRIAKKRHSPLFLYYAFLIMHYELCIMNCALCIVHYALKKRDRPTNQLAGRSTLRTMK